MAKVLCATCGIQTETGEEAKDLGYAGQLLHFSSQACRELFLSDPAAYLAGSSAPETINGIEDEPV